MLHRPQTKTGAYGERSSSGLALYRRHGFSYSPQVSEEGLEGGLGTKTIQTTRRRGMLRQF